MGIVPAFADTCEYARRMPSLVAEFMEYDKRVGRRFREDSITDILIASLLQIPSSNVVVVTPPEHIFGSDFDIVIVDEKLSDIVQYRIQAKRLYPHATRWERGSYRELCHPHNTGKQVSTLLRSSSHEAIPTIPLYAFYNPEWVCAASTNGVEGVSLADAKEIGKVVRTIVRSKPSKTTLKRLEHLQPLLFPLSTILCPGGTAPRSAIVPSPMTSRQAVLGAIAARAEVFRGDLPRLPQTESGRLPSPPPPIRDTSDEDDNRLKRPSLARDPRPTIPQVIIDAVNARKDLNYIRSSKVRRPKAVLIAEAE